MVEPEFVKGRTLKNAVYMLCSDGFRHQISEQEMLDKIGPKAVKTDQDIEFGCRYLTETVKSRKESDNITVAVIKTA